MKKNWICMLGFLAVLLWTGCGNSEEAEKPNSLTRFVPVVVGKYEAEDAILTGNVMTEKNDGCSGGKYVTGFKEEEDTCVFSVLVEEDGFYDLAFWIASTGGKKTNFIEVDGSYVGEINTDVKEYCEDTVRRIWMEKGEHSVSVKVSWGWINMDYMELRTSEPLSESFYDIEAKLSNPNAGEEAKRLMSYLCDIYGEYFLSGQVCNDGEGGLEFIAIKKVTGKVPAVLGVDFGDYTPTNVSHGSRGNQVEAAQLHWENGGIVEIHWHWNTPDRYVTGTWYKSFYTKHTGMNLKNIMDGEDEAGYEDLMADIDAIAEQLKRLQDAGVPVLFRPLHEASGGWFWWGASGAEAYKELYILLYEKLTEEHQLNNLIWVWNGQDAEWYPGDEYVDIIGEDIYQGERVYTSQISRYLEAASFSGERKLVYLTECGCIFDPDLAKRDGAMWGMWAVWSGEFVRKTGSIAAISEQYTEIAMMKKAYEHEFVLTLDELPDLKTYPISKSFFK